MGAGHLQDGVAVHIHRADITIAPDGLHTHACLLVHGQVDQRAVPHGHDVSGLSSVRQGAGDIEGGDHPGEVVDPHAVGGQGRDAGGEPGGPQPIQHPILPAVDLHRAVHARRVQADHRQLRPGIPVDVQQAVSAVSGHQELGGHRNGLIALQLVQGVDAQLVDALDGAPADHHFLFAAAAELHIIDGVDSGAVPLHHRADLIALGVSLGGEEIDPQGALRPRDAEGDDRSLLGAVAVHILKLDHRGVVAGVDDRSLHRGPILHLQAGLDLTALAGQVLIAWKALRKGVQILCGAEQAAGQQDRQRRRQQRQPDMSSHVPFPPLGRLCRLENHPFVIIP